MTDVDASELELAPAAGDESFEDDAGADADADAEAVPEAALAADTPPARESADAPDPAVAPVAEAASAEGTEAATAATPGPAEAQPDASEPEAAAERAAPTEPMSVGRMFADSIRRAGVRWAFTVPGESFLGLLEGLEAAGIDRERAFVTNVVKHFKWRPDPRSRRRLHERPDRAEVLRRPG